ncbi:MAG TPA: PIG-L family deacetylase [Candidatus Dormibacteraeota bacterium]|nr:PIG-L family deacetylase [Candidatus Dormibacteraeota bacterium]
MGTLFLVHAHPDDEAIATGGVMLRAHAQGHRVVLVTCTRGEEGEIHNMDETSVRPRLAQVRTEELAHACQILGVDRQEFLGFRDSGMAGTPANDHPNSFHRASLQEAAERLAGLLRAERPEVVVTYTPDGTYGHPDHIKAHLTTMAALDLLDGEGWRPAKLYWHAIPRSVVEEMSRRAEEMRRRSGGVPEEPAVRLLGVPDEEITTVVDVRDLAARKREAFAAHVSQNDPHGPFAEMQGQVLEAALGRECFVLVRGRLGTPPPEPDLFAGLPG